MNYRKIALYDAETGALKHIRDMTAFSDADISAAKFLLEIQAKDAWIVVDSNDTANLPDIDWTS